MRKPIFVFAHLTTEEPVIAGILEYDEAARLGVFRYVKSYLERPDAIPFSMREAFALSPSITEEIASDGIPGPIRDALPDYWGRLVYASRRGIPVEKVSNTEMLLAKVIERPGFLDFSETPEWRGSHLSDADIPVVDDLPLLVQTADALASNQPIPAEHAYLLKLLAQGTTMGGARPKSVIRLDDGLWLAKFPAARDQHDVSAVEYATLAMARDAGLTVPDARLLPLPDGRHVFLSRRFDRTSDGLRIPMVSALTALALDEFENAKGSYSAMGDTLRQQGDGQNMRELFARMAFNVLIRNTDDHLRNHAFLYDRSCHAWKLSPAYDVNPGISKTGVGTEFDLSINIGRYGRAASLENIHSAIPSFGISASESGQIIRSILNVIANWQQYFQAAGVDARTAELFADTFASSLERFSIKKVGEVTVSVPGNDKTGAPDCDSKAIPLTAAIPCQATIDRRCTMPTVMMQRNNLANTFVQVNDKVTVEALAAAKAEVGDAAWKQGWSEETQKVARDQLKAHGAETQREVKGRLTGVSLAETTANGEKMQKLRVSLDDGDNRTLLSADLHSEFAQRLIAKLDTAIEQHPGEMLAVGAFAEPVERNGKPYVNHVALLKDEQGQEITANPEHTKAAQEKVVAAQKPMRDAGMDQPKILNQVAKGAREAYFAEVVQGLSEKLKEQGITTEHTQKTPPPRLEAHLQEPDGTWRSVGLWADKDGQLQGVMATQRPGEETERHKVSFVEKTSRNGVPMLQAAVTREDESRLFVTMMPHESKSGERFMSASFAEKEQGGDLVRIEGKGGGLKPNDTALEQGAENRTVKAIQEKFNVNVLNNARAKDKQHDQGMDR